MDESQGFESKEASYDNIYTKGGYNIIKTTISFIIINVVISLNALATIHVRELE